MSEQAWVNSSTTASSPAFTQAELISAVRQIRETAHVIRARDGRVGVALGGQLRSPSTNGAPSYPLLGTLPPLYPEWLGDRAFCEAHGVRFPYIAGAMANGIATAELVVAMANAKMLGFFGAAGLSFDRVRSAIDHIQAHVSAGSAWGANLIHSPHEPDLEASVAALYIERGVTRVSASAYMELTPPLVRYAVSGLHVVGDQIQRRHFVFAKISRPEVARRFMQPAPAAMLAALVQRGWVTPQEAKLAEQVPVAEDITVESDSGGHTDNQALTAVFPVVARLRDRICAEQNYARPIRVGAAGGLGTPQSVAAAFSLGAAYVVTGSVNQAALESGLSTSGKELLAKASMADVVMAPAADMFEMGVKVQVLKRGTLFGPRAQRLYEAYVAHGSLEAMPAAVRAKLEKEVLGRPADEIWNDCRKFWSERDPKELARAEGDPKHRMALVFRWYLGLSSRWAIVGEANRRLDFQIWCGPAMGAFNDWASGSFLEPIANRTVVQIALNLLEGAAVATRAHQLRTYGAPVPSAAYVYTPTRLR